MARKKTTRGGGAEASVPENELDALYALPLEDFTPAKNALAKRLRQEGNADGSDEVKALAKPNVALWAINQVARSHPEDIRALLASSDRLREAQASALRGEGAEALREGTRAQRGLVLVLTEDVSEALRRAGREPNPTLVDQIQATLTAAANGTEEERTLLEKGRLSRPVERVSFGGLVDVRPLPPPPKEAKPRPSAAAKEAERAQREAAQRAKEAEARAKEAERERQKEEARAAREAEKSRAEEETKAAQEAERARREAEKRAAAAERERQAAQKRAEQAGRRAAQEAKRQHAEARRLEAQQARQAEAQAQAEHARRARDAARLRRSAATARKQAARLEAAARKAEAAAARARARADAATARADALRAEADAAEAQAKNVSQAPLH